MWLYLSLPLISLLLFVLLKYTGLTKQMKQHVQTEIDFAYENWLKTSDWIYKGLGIKFPKEFKLSQHDLQHHYDSI